MGIRINGKRLRSGEMASVMKRAIVDEAPQEFIAMRARWYDDGRNLWTGEPLEGKDRENWQRIQDGRHEIDDDTEL